MLTLLTQLLCQREHSQMLGILSCCCPLDLWTVVDLLEPAYLFIKLYDFPFLGLDSQFLLSQLLPLGALLLLHQIAPVLFDCPQTLCYFPLQVVLVDLEEGVDLGLLLVGVQGALAAEPEFASVAGGGAGRDGEADGGRSPDLAHIQQIDFFLGSVPASSIQGKSSFISYYPSMSVPRSDREAVSRLMLELQFQAKPRAELDQLMTTVGFEEDVAFAKSLFTQRIAAIYRDCNGEYEKFLGGEAILALPQSSRQSLLALFRKYHEHKLKGEEEDVRPLEGLKLPNPNKVEEVIAFQKKMYTLFKNLMPQGNTLNQAISPATLVPNPSKFTPFPIFPDRSFRNYENDFFPALGYLPTFGQRCSSYDQFKKRSSDNSFNRSDSLFQRPSFFSKNHFSEFEKADEEQRIDNGTVGQEEIDHMNPGKKVKRDSVVLNANFTPQNIQAMRRQLQQLKEEDNKDKE